MTDVNDAPVLDNSGAATLTTINENETSNGGDLVADIIASSGADPITDQDAGAVEGLAVISVDDANGTWQYSTNGGLVWTPFGTVSDNSASGMTLDESFFPEFDGLRTHQVRLEGGDASSDSYCFS